MLQWRGVTLSHKRGALTIHIINIASHTITNEEIVAILM
jgi:hypothetical protein